MQLLGGLTLAPRRQSLLRLLLHLQLTSPITKILMAHWLPPRPASKTMAGPSLPLGWRPNWMTKCPLPASHLVGRLACGQQCILLDHYSLGQRPSLPLGRRLGPFCIKYPGRGPLLFGCAAASLESGRPLGWPPPPPPPPLLEVANP